MLFLFRVTETYIFKFYIKIFNVIVLDDGYQDLSIKKDLNIICFHSKQKTGNGQVIPAGPLRESLDTLINCQIVLINGFKDLEFEQKLSREIEENPALDTINENLDNEKDEFDIEDNSENEEFNNDEIDISDYLSDEDIPDYNLRTNNHSEENENAIPFASGTSFNQFLKKQLHSFSFNSEDLKIAEFIVGSLDQFGYLRRDLIDISDDLAFSLGIDAQEGRIQKILE